MADTIKTVKSAGGDYSSLSAWEAGQQKSITAGNREIAECYSFDDSAAVQISGWTVPSGAEIIVRAAAANRHDGTFGTGYRCTNPASGGNNYYGGIAIQADRVTLEGLSIEDKLSSSGFARNACYVGNYVGAVIRDCIIKSVCTDSHALYIECGSNTAKVINSVVLSTAYRAFLPYTGTVYCYNCDFVGGAYGLDIGYATLYVKNCYSRGTTAGYDNGRGSYPSSVTFTTCRHSDSGSYTGSTGSTAYDTSNFTNVTAGSEDFHLPAGSALIDVGTDLSADADYPFSTDYAGDTRSGTWDIGPDEYVSAGASGHPTMRRWGGVPGMGQGQSFGRGW